MFGQILESIEGRWLERHTIIFSIGGENTDRLVLNHERHNCEDSGSQGPDLIVRGPKAELIRHGRQAIPDDRFLFQIGLRQTPSARVDRNLNGLERFVLAGRGNGLKPLAARVSAKNAEPVKVEHLTARLEDAIEFLDRNRLLAFQARRIEFSYSLRQFAMGDVGPGADNFFRTACIVSAEPETYLGTSDNALLCAGSDIPGGLRPEQSGGGIQTVRGEHPVDANGLARNLVGRAPPPAHIP